MERITKTQLEAVVSRINTVAGTPQKPYEKVGDKWEPQAKCYHLSGAYGGYALHQMVNDGGGVRDIFGGHLPKRELYERMHAFIRGLETKAA